MAATLQVIDHDGKYDKQAMDEFAENCKLASSGISYCVVSIMGPQSSGKSTLMNHVFGTKFTQMDAMKGRSQTTQGIWLASSTKVTDQLTMILDLEGSDGRERGEDDTRFEKQTALFALAISDIVLINLWCHDIGREHGSGKPLLKTIFQVHLKLFTPEAGKRRTVLLFVIRDKSKTPLAKLTEVLEADLNVMWDSLAKPPGLESTTLADFFELQYAALPNFEEKEEEFLAECVLLRRRFTPDGEGSLIRAGDKLPGSVFNLSSEKVWDIVHSHKDLNLPAHKTMVATIRCADIAGGQQQQLVEDPAWEGLLKDSAAGFVEDFGQRAGGLIDSCIEGYDVEAMYFDESVRGVKKQELDKALRELIQEPFEQQVEHLKADIVAGFEREVVGEGERAARDGDGGDAEGQEDEAKGEGVFEERAEVAMGNALKRFDEAWVGVDWAWLGQNGAVQREQLQGRLQSVQQGLVDKQIECVVSASINTLPSRLQAPVIELLDQLPDRLWPTLSSLYHKVNNRAAAEVDVGLAGYGLDDVAMDAVRENLRSAGLNMIRERAKEAANTAGSRLKDRFVREFNFNSKGVPRTWYATDDIGSIEQAAKAATSKALSALTIFRLDGQGNVVTTTDIDAALEKYATSTGPGGAEGNVVEASSSYSLAEVGVKEEEGEELDVRLAMDWEGVESEDVLLSPERVRAVWRQFGTEAQSVVYQATITQQAHKSSKRGMPPFWAIGLLCFLGFNEATMVLQSPMLLAITLIISIVSWMLYSELDIDGELQKGWVPGAVSIAGKTLPAMQSVSQRTYEASRSFAYSFTQQGGGGGMVRPVAGQVGVGGKGEEFTDIVKEETKKEA